MMRRNRLRILAGALGTSLGLAGLNGAGGPGGLGAVGRMGGVGDIGDVGGLADLPGLAAVGSALGEIGAAGAAALLAAGCSRRGDSGPASPATDAEWAWLEAAKRQLDAKRAQLANADGAAVPLPGFGPAGVARGTPAAGAPAAPTRDALEHEVDTLAAELGRRLVDTINANPPVEDTPLTAHQLAAVRMKSDEEIVVAQEFISRAGDYRRACEILTAALAIDPLNPRLRDQLASAQAARYVTRERFARVAPAMTPEQIRDALGPPNAHDVRTYPQRASQTGGIVAWFYPRDPNGAAAAVWFQTSEGRWLAYRCDWDALPAATASGTGTGSALPVTGATPPHPAPGAGSPSPPMPTRQPAPVAAGGDPAGPPPIPNRG